MRPKCFSSFATFSCTRSSIASLFSIPWKWISTGVCMRGPFAKESEGCGYFTTWEPGSAQMAGSVGLQQLAGRSALEIEVELGCVRGTTAAAVELRALLDGER